MNATRACPTWQLTNHPLQLDITCMSAKTVIVTPTERVGERERKEKSMVKHEMLNLFNQLYLFESPNTIHSSHKFRLIDRI